VIRKTESRAQEKDVKTSGVLPHVEDSFMIELGVKGTERSFDGDVASQKSKRGCPASRWVERKLQHPVVKAFNNVYAQHLMKPGLPAGTPEHRQLTKWGS
jgi:predicted dinucleotide-binding enzyme